MKAGYKNLSARSVTYREYDLGEYIVRCVFTLDGKKAATYEEPKEMSGYCGKYCGFAPKCTITYTSDKAETEVKALAEQYRKDKPLAGTGRFKEGTLAEDMLSQLAWTAEMIKACEKFTHHYGTVYVESSGLKHEPGLGAFFATSNNDLNQFMSGREEKACAWTDLSGNDFVNDKINSVFMSGEMR